MLLCALTRIVFSSVPSSEQDFTRSPLMKVFFKAPFALQFPGHLVCCEKVKIKKVAVVTIPAMEEGGRPLILL